KAALRTFAAALIAVSATTVAAQALYDEYEVKAAFLYHFGTYVDWPPAAETDPITIAILAEPAIAGELASFLPVRTIQSRPVEVVAVSSIEEAADAEILFIGRAENARLRTLISELGQRATLVVSDSPTGLDQGAIVNFLIVDSRVRFEISVPNAAAAGLGLSSRLLAAALRVRTP